MIYEDILLKGKVINFSGKRFYTGDIEFDIGFDTKYVSWKYNIVDKVDSRNYSWIKVNEFIPLPHMGFKYYRYKLTAYANVSALSFQDANSMSVRAGIDYNFVDGFYLNVGYVYENFDVLEDSDFVYFQADGVKVGFKYRF